MNPSKMKSLVTVLLLLILIIAIFFRFWSLDTAPPSLYPDEAVNGVNAIETSESGDYRVFYPDNNGREGLYVNLSAIAFNVFGISAQSLRAISAIFGVLMVLGIFFLTKLLWGRKIALLATYLSAIGFWAVNFSRIGFRAIMLPAVLVWSFYFLWLGIKRRKTWPIILSGLIFGIGMHTYISFRIAPLVLVALFILLLFVNRIASRKELLKWAFVFFVGAIIIASPLLIYYLQNPVDFISRAGQISVFNESSPVTSFISTGAKTLGMFTFVGDFNWRHNFAGRALLFWPIGIGFLLGIIILLGRLRKRELTHNHFLLTWWFIMLFPNFFSPEGAPHALRALGAMPAVYIISAIGLVYLYEKIQKYFTAWQSNPQYSAYENQLGKIKKGISILAICILLFVGVWEARTYFVKWASRAETANAFEQELTDISDFIISSSAKNKFIIENSGGVAIYTITFHTWEYKNEIKFVHENEINTLPNNLDDTLMVLVHKDTELLEKLKIKYPQAQALGEFDGIRIK